MTKNLYKFKLELIVFVSGAVVMVLEMAGSRVMAPYLGTSLFVWTGLIGIVMGSLSIGYYWGGKLADREVSYKILSRVLLFAGFSILITNIIKRPVLEFTQQAYSDIRASSIINGVILFSLPSFLLGIVSPYSVKLKLDSLKTSGATVGNLYAISTAGSIFGTFIAGFYLISYFGTDKIMYLLSGTMLALSILSHSKSNKKESLILLLLLSVFTITQSTIAKLKEERGYYDIDTQYNRVLIFDDKDERTGRPIRRMNLGMQFSSAMFLDGDGVVYPYENYYHLAPFFNANIRKSLVLGGAAYSFPKDYLAMYPEATIDVVEIDPDLTTLAMKYFNLSEDPRMNIYHEDGRTYINRNETKYDAIFVDVFNDRFSLPFQLTTKEAVERIYNSLDSNGVVVINTIGTLGGKESGFLSSEYYTYKEYFPQVFVFPVMTNRVSQRQNLMLVALKGTDPPNFDQAPLEYKDYLAQLWTKEIPNTGIILTDDFCPIERFFSTKM